jgi:hypothetical protein
MSRRRRVGAVLAAAGALLVAAPMAAAEQYEFVASDGTTCTLEKAHGSGLEPDGEWTIGWGAGVTCRGAPLWGANVHSELWRFAPSGAPVTYAPDTSGFCTRPTPGAHRPCGTWTVRSDGIEGDLPGDVYEHHTTLSLTLPGAGAVQPVWLVTPVAAGCLPGGQTTGCSVVEEFKPE